MVIAEDVIKKERNSMIKITKKLGNATITAEIDEGSDLPKALVGADWILNAPTYCNICHGQNLHFSARTSKAKSGKNAGKEFSYAQMRCKTKDCWSTATLGKFADGSGYFWRDGGKFVKYEGGNNNKNSQTTKEDTALAPSDDIPF